MLAGASARVRNGVTVHGGHGGGGHGGRILGLKGPFLQPRPEGLGTVTKGASSLKGSFAVTTNEPFRLDNQWNLNPELRSGLTERAFQARIHVGDA